MPRHLVAPLPEGYIIVRIQGKQYPMKLALSASGVPSAQGFIHRIDGQPVTYSKRMYAANFIELYKDGRAPWAEIDGAEPPPNEQARRQFLDSAADNEEYTAYVEHTHAPRASEY